MSAAEAHRVPPLTAVRRRSQVAIGIHEPAHGGRCEPGQIDQGHDDRLGRRVFDRPQAHAKRGPHAFGPVGIGHHHGAGHIAHPGSEDDVDRVASTGTQHAHRTVDQPLTINDGRGLGTSEATSLPRCEDEPGDAGHDRALAGCAGVDGAARRRQVRAAPTPALLDDLGRDRDRRLLGRARSQVQTDG